MRKGAQITHVEIDNGRITAYAKLKTTVIELALTRTQRNIFKHYANHDFLNQVETEFGNSAILSDDFYVKVDGEIVYRK